MNIDLNFEFVAEYKQRYTTKLVHDKIGESGSISGKEILKLTSSKQFNFLVIKILFQEWQEEMKHLESPYFDYKEPEVRKAMVNFMNVLSQHIKVSEQDFQPLLEKAFDELLLLAVDPATFLKEELKDRQSSELSVKLTKQLTKYVVLLKEEMNEFLKEVEGDSLQEVIQKATYYFEGHDSARYLADLVDVFTEVVEVDYSDFLASGQAEAEVLPEMENEPIPEDPEPESIEVPEPAAEAPSVEDEDDSDPEDTLNKKYEIEAKTLADLHEEKKINSVMEAISINHRYMFLQELFDGDNDQFQKAISEVEQCTSFDEAVEMLVQNYAKEYFWDMNSDEVKELLKVIFRRFRS